MKRSEKWEQRLATPVLLAALASVPAVFLTLFDDPYATVGTVVNWLSGAVLVSETVVLLAVSTNKWAWLGENWLLVALSLGVVLAVVLAIGPLQLLRLLRVFGALRIVRAGRIVKAVRLLRERRTRGAWWIDAGTLLLAVLVVAFVVVILADPTSATRELIDEWLSPGLGVVLVLLAGAILAGATFVVASAKRRDADTKGDEQPQRPTMLMRLTRRLSSWWAGAGSEDR